MVALPFYNLVLRTPKPDYSPYPKELRTIGDHIRKVRLDRGLLQKDVAKLFGITTDTLTGWELNRHRITTRYWVAVREFLGYDIPHIVLNDENRVIIDYRHKHNVTIKEYAKMVGRDADTIRRIERGIL